MKANSPTPDGIIPIEGSGAENDRDLDIIFGDFISQITGLSRNLCRRRWQENPPPQPDRNMDWCALGIVDIEPDINDYKYFQDGIGLTVGFHETLSLLVSFYGPNATLNAMNLRIGLTLSQNRIILSEHGMAFMNATNPVRFPELINRLFLPRTDITLKIRRHEKRIYPIKSAVSSDGVITAEYVKQSFTTENIK